jgi:hypothetical protein
MIVFLFFCKLANGFVDCWDEKIKKLVDCNSVFFDQGKDNGWALDRRQDSGRAGEKACRMSLPFYFAPG